MRVRLCPKGHNGQRQAQKNVGHLSHRPRLPASQEHRNAPKVAETTTATPQLRWPLPRPASAPDRCSAHCLPSDSPPSSPSRPIPKVAADRAAAAPSLPCPASGRSPAVQDDRHARMNPAISSFASVVTMAKDCSQCPCRSFQASHRPAKRKGAPLPVRRHRAASAASLLSGRVGSRRCRRPPL